ncbi:hypothetical protein QJS04_geneDACA002119 [Acorus gramineus]|uniref:DUF7895 domain-containing protein n=1 Tax=Acorus gramineus TaxID=55184 RepID=A0AAV9A7X6_ACOGR|nr:hypothetical protein QJS04_geneDACA002119 [Acorus gramineus]
MESLLLPTSSKLPFFMMTIRYTNPNVQNAHASDSWPPFRSNSYVPGGRKSLVSHALPETALSVAVAAVAVGTAASFLARTIKPPETVEKIPLKVCEDCGGSGICSECNGEGFVPKKLSQESADRARMAAKNMATRFTSGLPKKWSYCSKCRAARSCTTCGGSGKLGL